MPILFRVLAFCVPCVVLCSQPALAGDVDWRVALSGSTASISQPPLPAAHTFRGAGLADAGAGLLGFQWSANTNLLNPDGNWFESGSTFTQYAGVGVIGAQGPGRSGAESTHVFRRLYYGDAFNAAARAFGATANDPADPAGNASTGAWLWDGTKNVEIARVGASGALGPGLDGGRIYKTLHHIDDVNHDVNVWMLPNQRVLLEGRIGTASTLGSDGLSVYTPGAAIMRACYPAPPIQNMAPASPMAFSMLTLASAFGSPSVRVAKSMHAVWSRRPVAGHPAGLDLQESGVSVRARHVLR